MTSATFNPKVSRVVFYVCFWWAVTGAFIVAAATDSVLVLLAQWAALTVAYCATFAAEWNLRHR